MQLSLTDQLQWIADSTSILVPELILVAGILSVILLNIFRVVHFRIYGAVAIASVTLSGLSVLLHWHTDPVSLFNHLLRADDFSSAYKLLFALGTLLTFLLSLSSGTSNKPAEYCSLLLTATLGANLLVMSTSFITVILSLELISISTYVLAGFHFTKPGAEGSLKYFLFGSAATAIMIYGISLLFGLSGTLNFTSSEFVSHLITQHSPLVMLSGFFILAGFLFKASAVPFHLWAPDVYEAAPLPVVAFLSVVPKLAGVAALLKFTLAINLFGQSFFDWQTVIAAVAILSIVVGNLSALAQKEAKRMMAYSSIAQAGFLMAAMAPLSLQSMQFMIFYSAVFLIMNFAVFTLLQQFETTYKTTSIHALAGLAKTALIPSVLLTMALIALTGLPPTAGFTAKLFVFSSIWEAFTGTGKSILLWLLLIGLLNTVISLFFYLKIPFYLFIRANTLTEPASAKSFTFTNLLGLVLVIALFVFFFYPALLMGWLNRINFVL
ncbi:MAG: NADH-quinone oxidoreductase subunit N [Azospira oryzae]|nr:MAG: NADH-quinone oxidoreductase subunit N [Azospira oryzae]